MARSQLVRPSTPTGDPGGDERLAASLVTETLDRMDLRRERARREDFLAYLAIRTRFFDDLVLEHVTAGMPQVVILGAGYDGRALRFRTPGTRFFEVDHPATQRDKLRRLAAIGAGCDDITFVAADFTDDTLGPALDAAGHDAGTPSLLVCEGVLRYLPEHWWRELLRVAGAHAAPGSELAVSISIREPDIDTDAAAAEDRRRHEERLAASGEPVLTVPDRETALAWVADTGWDEDAAPVPDTRRWLLLRRRR
jgi:methyltransferase (TIGR00027 family)